MDDAIEVIGLSALSDTDPRSGEPAAWRPVTGQSEPEMLTLTLRYRGCDYAIQMARTLNGARQLGVADDRLEPWMRQHKGWWVRVSGPQGTYFSAAYSTLEAAVLGALSIPPLLHGRGNVRQEV